MSAESDATGDLRRVSATEAIRSFSRLLDSVERGNRILVRRRGEDVCMMTAPPTTGRRASECLDLLRNRPPVVLDDRFGDDLLDVIAGEPIDHRPPWDC